MMNRLLLTAIDDSCLIGYIDFIILDKEVNINELFIYKYFRGKKYGTYILYKLIEMVKTENKKIILEDCTKRYRKNNNIYKNLGFYYIHSKDAHMELNLENYNLETIIDIDIIDIENKVNISLFSFKFI